MIAWLLDHGADPNRQCVINLTPLSLAVESAPVPVIHLMLSRGGDTQKAHLLHHAIEQHSDNIAVLSLVVEKGTAINSTMYEDHYPSRALFSFMDLGTPRTRLLNLEKWMWFATWSAKERTSVSKIQKVAQLWSMRER